MSQAALIIFLITYAGVAIGRVPGLALDRTGIALLGAIAMTVTGVLTEIEAAQAVDLPTILLLYALMVISAQLRLGGFYAAVARRISRLMNHPARFLLIMMIVSAALSALLANDIICLAMTPVLCVALLRANLNPLPFLLGLAAASNIGSAATIIGNPQNMLIGQMGRLHFGEFLLWCGPPAVIALAGAYAILYLGFRGALARPTETTAAPRESGPAYNGHQTRKGLLAVALLLIFFFTHIPRELTAITIAGWLLCSRRMQTRSILGLVDWHLITLFIGLFVVIRGIESSGLPAQALAILEQYGIDIRNHYVLGLVAIVLSNLVSNVPAAMLLIKFLDPGDPVAWYMLAAASTFAGNLITIGSIANLITFEQAAAFGVKISFRQHARVGIPVTLFSLLALLGWAWLSRSWFGP